jgi:hypothetical protein
MNKVKKLESESGKSGNSLFVLAAFIGAISAGIVSMAIIMILLFSGYIPDSDLAMGLGGVTTMAMIAAGAVGGMIFCNIRIIRSRKEE